MALIGRGEELDEIARARAEGLSGVVLLAPAGRGKSRLARVALEQAERGGAVIRWVQATRSAASVPLGAFADAIDTEVRSDDLFELLRQSARAVLDAAGRRPLVVGVDDAHLLDPTSAALVLHLATSTAAFVLATVRAGESCPDAIVSLWKDAGAHRIELASLDQPHSGELAESIVGGPLEQGARHWAWQTSQGNALYIRELLRGALDSGALAKVGGLWRMRARPPISGSLAELVSARIGELTGPERETLELLALGEPLRLSELAALVGLKAVGGCESHGLVIVDGVPPLGGVRLAHPLYGEAISAGLGSLRAREIRLALAQAVQRREVLSPDASIRVARWLLEAGEPIPSRLVLDAARAANLAGDPALAGTLAARALDDENGMEATLLLARSYTIRNQFAEAEHVLAAAEPRIDTRDSAVEFLEQQIAVLYWGLKRPDLLRELFERAQNWWPDRAWRDRLAPLRLRAGLLASMGDTGSKTAEVKGLLANEELDPAERRRLQVVALAGLFHSGQGPEAYALARQVRPEVPLRDPTDEGMLALWIGISGETGDDWPDLEQWSTAGLQHAVRLGDHAAAGLTALALGHLRIVQGRFLDAGRLLAEAQLHHEARDPIGLLVTTSAMQAGVGCFTGNPAAAHAGLVRCRAALAGQPPSPIQVPWVVSAEAWVAFAQADAPRAQRTLLEAAAGLGAFPFYAARLTYEAMRSGAPARTVAPALTALSLRCSSPLVSARAAHAVHRADRDAKALMQTVEKLAGIGALLYASEAAAHAAQIFVDDGRQDSARRAAASSRGLFAEHQGGTRPAILGFDSDAVALSPRETQLVALAASGLSNAEIADRLVLSIRTVESHLYRAMQKLGVNDRRDLQPLGRH